MSYHDDDDEWGDGFQNYEQRMRNQDDDDDNNDDDDDDGDAYITITLPNDFHKKVDEKILKTVSKIFNWIKN